MPRTGRRVLSCRTKVFHAARSGRGRAVTSTVSSMSLTTATCAVGSTMRIRATDGPDPVGTQLGLHPAGLDGRGGDGVDVAAAAADHLVLAPADAHRHRDVCGGRSGNGASRGRAGSRWSGGRSSTRASTRTQPSVP